MKSRIEKKQWDQCKVFPVEQNILKHNENIFEQTNYDFSG